MLYEELDDRFGRRKKRTVIFGMAGGTPPTPPTPPTPSVLEEKDLNFYDFDGTLVASYGADEIAGLTELPEPPDHSADEVPLTFEEWNWTLEEIKEYHTDMPENKIDVGATYHPTDGNTHAIFVLENDNDPSGVQVSLSDSWTIDWGDGTVETGTGYKTKQHVYTRKGRYHCKITGGSVSPGFTGSDSDAPYAGKITELYVSAIYSRIFSASMDYARCLEKVTLPNSIDTIDAYSFRETYRLGFCVIPRRVTSLPSSVFGYSGVSLVAFPATLTSIRTYAFQYARSLRRATLPAHLSSIGEHCFWYCSSLKEVYLGNEVATIGLNAFDETNIKDLALPESAVNLGNYMLRAVRALRRLRLPTTLSAIGTGFVSGCYSLQKIEIPASVENIGASAFSTTYSLAIITVLATTPPTLGSNAFYSDIQKIYVPAESVEAYKSATNWANYAEKIEAIPE